jgi:hypothetical protein
MVSDHSAKREKGAKKTQRWSPEERIMVVLLFPVFVLEYRDPALLRGD